MKFDTVAERAMLNAFAEKLGWLEADKTKQIREAGRDTLWALLDKADIATPSLRELRLTYVIWRDMTNAEAADVERTLDNKDATADELIELMARLVAGYTICLACIELIEKMERE